MNGSLSSAMAVAGWLAFALSHPLLSLGLLGLILLVSLRPDDTQLQVSHLERCLRLSLARADGPGADG